MIEYRRKSCVVKEAKSIKHACNRHRKGVEWWTRFSSQDREVIEGEKIDVLGSRRLGRRHEKPCFPCQTSAAACCCAGDYPKSRYAGLFWLQAPQLGQALGRLQTGLDWRLNETFCSHSRWWKVVLVVCLYCTPVPEKKGAKKRRKRCYCWAKSC